MAHLDESWRDRAACEPLEGIVDFFPELGEDTKPAQRVCAVCPVAEECLIYALQLRIKHGVWGGTTERQRRDIRVTYRVRVCLRCQDAEPDGLSMFCAECLAESRKKWARDNHAEPVTGECVVCNGPATKAIFGRPSGGGACARWECQRILERERFEAVLQEVGAG